ncbi:MAG: peptidylprolyl isomerase, partial [Phycisphaerae bacterium]
PAPVPAPAGGEVMAYVNDRPIYMAELNRLLVAGYGMSVAQQLVANELVREQAERQNVTVSEDDLDAEHDRTLRSMFGTVDDPNQRERLLDQLLTRNRVSEQQWRLTMRRNALLAKLAEKQLTVTEDDLKEEFGRQHERKVQVQHIQTASLADAQEILRKLASGEAFAAMVAKHSIGPSAKDGGMLAPFGVKDTGTPPAIREAALAMRKVGEVSEPIQIGTAFHLVKLIRIIEPKDVKYELVKGALLAAVRERKIKALQQDILQILIRGGAVRYVNPILKSQADKESQP